MEGQFSAYLALEANHEPGKTAQIILSVIHGERCLP